MQNFILACSVVATVLAISSIRSPRLRAIIYCLPIPMSIVILGTDSKVNTSHPFSLLLVLVFTFSVWLLYKKLGLPIILSIALGACLYVLLGLGNSYIIKIPFMPMYIFEVFLWLLWVIVQPLRFSGGDRKTHDKPLAAIDYAQRGAIVFVCTYILIGIKGLIFGAIATFPFNGIFTSYIMKDQLTLFANELGRNFLGLFNFFLTVYLFQDKIGLGHAVAIGWVVCAVTIFFISRYVPRRHPQKAGRS